MLGYTWRLRLFVAVVTLTVATVFSLTGRFIGARSGQAGMGTLGGAIVALIVTQPFLFFLLRRRLARVPEDRKDTLS